MAITSAVAVHFCDVNVRPIADKMVQLHYLCQGIVDAWNALGGAALIPNTTAVLQDGAAPNGVDATGGDGRPVITGAMVNNLINRCNEVLSSAASTGLATNAAGIMTTILQVAVNPQR